MSTTEQLRTVGLGTHGDQDGEFRFDKHTSPIQSGLAEIPKEYYSVNERHDKLFDLSEFCHANQDWESPANTSEPNHYTVTYPSIGLDRSFSQPPHQAFPGDKRLLRGDEKYTEPSSTSYREQAHTSNLPHNIQLLTRSDHMESFPHMDNTHPYTQETPRPAKLSSSKYSPYKARFCSSGSASKHRKEATRFNRMPYRQPDMDPTIVEVERNRLYHVERVYNAMTRGDAARDNKGSIAMKRWVHGAYYDSGLVEAYAHKVLDCLLLQAKEGFRGWIHNDYVADDRKGDDEDRDVTCEQRLESIIRALQEEKTICEDVMNSACQIRMFVNAPKAYANRKYQNRVGNSKRGRVKESDAGGASSKMRKLNPRPIARSRRTDQTKASEASPHGQFCSQRTDMLPANLPRVRFSTPQTSMGSPKAYQLPTLDHLQDMSSMQSRSHAISPSNASPYISTPQPQQRTPIASPSALPPALRYACLPAQASAEDKEQVRSSTSHQWLSIQQCGESYQPSEPLFDASWRSTDDHHAQSCAGTSTNIVSQCSELAGVTVSPRYDDTGGARTQPAFTEYWKAQPGVQQFPFTGHPTTHD